MDELINQMIAVGDEASYIQRITGIDQFELIKKYFYHGFGIKEIIDKGFDEENVKTIAELNKEDLIKNYFYNGIGIEEIINKGFDEKSIRTVVELNKDNLIKHYKDIFYTNEEISDKLGIDVYELYEEEYGESYVSPSLPIK